MRIAPLFLLLLLLPETVHCGVAAMPWTPQVNQFGSLFGAAVAPAGDVDGDGYGDVLVGAPAWDETNEDEGRAFLFRGTANGISNTPLWSWSPGEDFAAAGTAVACAGDVDGDGYAEILVGMPNWDSPSGVDAGAVFVFKGSASGPSPAPWDTLWYGPDGAHFGSAVAWAGDVNGDGKPDVIVGSPDYQNGHAGEGEVTVWLGAVPYAPLPSFALEPNNVNAHLGFSVSGAGDVNGDGLMDIICGAPGALVGGHPVAGRAFVYAGANSVSGIGSLLRGYAGLADSAQVGYAVANAGDVNGDGYADIVIGAPGVEVSVQRGGAAYIYPGSPTGPTTGTLLTYIGDFFEGRFGSAVGTAGDLDGDGYADVLIGSNRYPEPDNAHGLVLVASGGKNGPTLTEFLNSPTGPSGFATAFATTGDATGDGYAEFIVGAPTYADRGTAFAWTGKPSGPVAAANSPLLAPDAGASFGTSLAILPRVDTGAFPTLAIAEPVWDLSGIGRVDLYHGQWGSLALSSFVGYQGTEGSQTFGIVVKDAGDVDRDGFTDFVVSSPGWDGGGPVDHGKVTLYMGGGSGPVVSAWPGEENYQAAMHFGQTIGARGDVNGDGYHDVAIGAPNYDSEAGTDAGLVSVYLGGPSGLGFPASWLRSGPGPFTDFGRSVALAGDLDADGYSDMAIGVLTHPGHIEVYFGSPAGPMNSPGWNITTAAPVTSVSTAGPAGDWDGDGVDDLLACGGGDADGKGTVALYAGSRARTSPREPLWSYRDPGLVGFPNPAGGGDLNGDGYSDVVVGAPQYSNGESSEGRILVFYGRPLANTGQVLVPDFTFEPNLANARLGQGIAVGDLNGDGFSDIVAGAPGADRVYAWFGGGEGVPRLSRFTEYGFGSLLRWSPARLDNETYFNAQQSQRSAGGRDRISEEYEVQLQGTPFTGIANRFKTNPYDSGAPGSLGSMISGNYSEPAPWKATTSRFKRRDVTSSPYFPRSRWMSPEARLYGEYDFRTGGTVTGVPAGGDLSALRVAPNPVRAAATVEFTLAEAARGSISLYDVRGRRVREIVRGVFPAGPSSFVFAARDVSAGLYFVVLHAGSVEQRCRVVLMP